MGKKEKNPAAKRKKRRLRGYLCAAFATVAAATVIGGAVVASQSHGSFPGGSSSVSASVTPSTPDAEPDVLQAFGVTATRTPLADNPYAGEWDAMLKRQQNYLKNPEYAQKYRDFLAQFDDDKGKPLAQLATDVNVADQGEITFTEDTNCAIPNLNDVKCGSIDKGADYFWLSPAEIVMRGKGNCVNEAVLQYFIMRYLGVPADRLFIADVNAAGAPVTAGPDHTILLLNIAQAGKRPQLLVLNDGGPVDNTNRYISQGTARFKPIEWPISRTTYGDWLDAYSFFDAFNGASSWQTPDTKYDYTKNDTAPPGQRASSSTQSARASMVRSGPRPKAQVARVNPPAFRPFGKA